jgi:hypothetical protein
VLAQVASIFSPDHRLYFFYLNSRVLLTIPNFSFTSTWLRNQTSERKPLPWLHLQRRTPSRARPRLPDQHRPWLPDRHWPQSPPKHKPPCQVVRKMPRWLKCLLVYEVSNYYSLILIYAYSSFLFSGDWPAEKTSSGETKRKYIGRDTTAHQNNIPSRRDGSIWKQKTLFSLPSKFSFVLPFFTVNGWQFL